MLWTTSSVEEMMQTNQIRADLPDAIHEPELYHKVLAHQVHTCDLLCCSGPAPEGE